MPNSCTVRDIWIEFNIEFFRREELFEKSFSLHPLQKLLVKGFEEDFLFFGVLYKEKRLSVGKRQSYCIYISVT